VPRTRIKLPGLATASQHKHGWFFFASVVQKKSADACSRGVWASLGCVRRGGRAHRRGGCAADRGERRAGGRRARLLATGVGSAAVRSRARARRGQSGHRRHASVSIGPQSRLIGGRWRAHRDWRNRAQPSRADDGRRFAKDAATALTLSRRTRLVFSPREKKRFSLCTRLVVIQRSIFLLFWIQTPKPCTVPRISSCWWRCWWR